MNAHATETRQSAPSSQPPFEILTTSGLPPVAENITRSPWYGRVRLSINQTDSRLAIHPALPQVLFELLEDRCGVAALTESNLHVHFLVEDGSEGTRAAVDEFALKIARACGTRAVALAEVAVEDSGAERTEPRGNGLHIVP